MNNKKSTPGSINLNQPKAPVRELKSDSIYTCDYIPERKNIVRSNDGKIIRIWYG